MENRIVDKELDKCKGALLGLAVGDALGTTLEFKSPGSFTPLTDMIGGGVFNLKAGKWTDDTSMALCLADSLIEKEDFDSSDQLDRYLRWMKHGYNSSTGTCFDIGNATRQALYLYERTQQPYCGDDSRDSAGNGSIMRLAPISIRYFNDSAQLAKYALMSSKTTHAAPQCIDACIYMAMLIAGAIRGFDKEALLSPLFATEPGFWGEHALDPSIRAIAEGSFKRLNPPDIYASGYVVKTLEAALWAFYRTSNFESGALKAVNLGDDADTVGAVYGQIAGAYYGMSGIPERWLRKLHRSLDIEVAAATLYELQARASGKNTAS